jgi:DNA-directed RNA polymerase specialized sigma24 family protein
MSIAGQPIPSEGSITLWLRQARHGDDQAISELCNRFLLQLAEKARTQFGQHPRTSLDEEDVAVVVLTSLFDKLKRGKFEGVRDRNELWCLLIRMTQQKVADEINRMMTIRNGEGRECVVSELDPANAARLENLTSDELNAEHWAILTELVETLLEALPDETTRRVARLKLEGTKSRDIAYVMKMVPRNVTRKLQLIQGIWLHRLNALDGIPIGDIAS